MDRVCSLRKILTRLRGTNFCTSLTCFALSIGRQPNSPKCTQIVQKARKQEFRVQWGGLGVFIAKNSNATLWHELLHQFYSICTEFCKATKQSKMNPKCRKRPKHEFVAQCCGSGAFFVKKSDGTSWHKVFHQFDLFYTKCCYATKQNQIHPNNTKHTKS